jgi:glycosyltransferase involved in cell wall biosynthesis
VRILQVIETGGPGGAETVFAQLASGLASRGHSVQCVVRDGSWLPGELQQRGFAPHLMRIGGTFDTTLLRQLVSQIREHRIDLVHAHLFDGAAYATLAAALCRVPSVTTLHGQVDVQRSGVGTRLKATLLRNAASAVVAVSGALRADLLNVLGIAPSRFHVIHNGLESLSTIVGLPVSVPAPRGEEPFRLVAVGNIRPAKDYPSLLLAIAALRQRDIHVHLDVLGQPDRLGLYEQLQEQIVSLSIQPHVTFHGFVRDPSAVLGRAHAFVLASSQEGFSLATIEAMLAGIPVVATMSGGPEEIIESDVTGLLVPPGNPAALATAIARLVQGPDLSRRLRESAWQSAHARFSMNKMLDAYESLYREVSSRTNA